MSLNRYFWTLAIMIAISVCFAVPASEYGRLIGKVKDENGKPLGFANIAMIQGGKLITGTQSKYNGKYKILNIPPGEYSVRFFLVGYKVMVYEKVLIEANVTSTYKVTLLNNRPIDIKQKDKREIDREQTGTVINIDMDNYRLSH